MRNRNLAMLTNRFNGIKHERQGEHICYLKYNSQMIGKQNQSKTRRGHLRRSKAEWHIKAGAKSMVVFLGVAV